MSDADGARDKLLSSLQERAKELNCLYQVESVCSRDDLEPAAVYMAVAEALKNGWQYPDVCEAEIVHRGVAQRTPGFAPVPLPWQLASPIMVQGEEVGHVTVIYTEKRPDEDEGPFLKEEVQLLRTVADRLAHCILFRRLRSWRQANDDADGREPTWAVPLHLLRGSDTGLYLRIARKFMNLLSLGGVTEAQAILQEVGGADDPDEMYRSEANFPGRRREQNESVLMTDAPLELAVKHLGEPEILRRVQQWMQEDKASFFLKVLDNPRASLQEIDDALRRYHHLVGGKTAGLPRSTRDSLRVSLIRRFLTDQLDYIKIAKGYLETTDFQDVLDRMVLPADSHGKLGGKGSGLLLAKRILDRDACDETPVGEIRVPRTRYVASDALLDFIRHNDLEDVLEQKYKDIEQVRQEYPNIIQLFKNSNFPPDLLKGLSLALDDFGDAPLIVRSSSLLEDRMSTAFSGKYKSLFLANQGTKKERLEALTDAIAEIYASVVGPDPIEYRRDRGLLDFNEEMGILIQEVVGVRVGPYWVPAFAGVAFSRNEFRWSSRIRREDGLIRLVPGLGTRAVDRTGDDYPTLVVPGQPKLRVNVAVDEVVRYAPKKIDVINLERNAFETVDIAGFVERFGSQVPGLARVFSILDNGLLKKPVPLLLDTARDDLIVTFNGLVEDTDFLGRFANMMKLLEEGMGKPVDVEFVHDGRDFYLLQCRPQSSAADEQPAPIPKDVPKENVVFSADRFVSNGWLPDVSHIVYVDPQRYSDLGERADMVAVGRAVGRLNMLLPKRQFILMGPGRWGSRGDIQLGVNVTYADISNTSMLVEIARRKGNYRPEVSFGTHFFQDLVESRIRYLPLFPDDEGAIFNEGFLLRSRNLLPELLPEFARLGEVLRVIDVAAASSGRVLRVLMNADLDEALALLVTPDTKAVPALEAPETLRRQREEFWRWRLQFAEHIAAETDAERFGVVAMYVFGSTKNATAGPGSDIDMLVHFRGSAEQRRDLETWMEGWSLCLGEMNYLRSGYRSRDLLDVHIVTDDDIARRTSYAVKIGAVTDAARPQPLGGALPPGRERG